MTEPTTEEIVEACYVLINWLIEHPTRNSGHYLDAIRSIKYEAEEVEEQTTNQ